MSVKEVYNALIKRISTDTLNWIVLIGIVLFIVEIAFFHGGVLWAAAFFGFLFYIGRKYYHELWGKISFWVGLIGLIVSVLNMIAIRFLIIVFIVLLLIDYMKQKRHVNRIEPILYVDIDAKRDKEPLIKTNPFFKQQLFGHQQTSKPAYEWHDINIHGGFGDRIIDLNDTVLPKDTAIISIRHLVGNITIYIPYDVEFAIHHSAIFGRAYILNEFDDQLMNQVLSYKTEKYDVTVPRVKIITSIASGNIEVKRI